MSFPNKYMNGLKIYGHLRIMCIIFGENINIKWCFVFQADYYSHPEHYTPVFHANIAPYASVIGMFTIL